MKFVQLLLLAAKKQCSLSANAHKNNTLFFSAQIFCHHSHLKQTHTFFTKSCNYIVMLFYISRNSICLKPMDYTQYLIIFASPEKTIKYTDQTCSRIYRTD